MSTETSNTVESEIDTVSDRKPTMSSKDRCDSCSSRAVLEVTTIYGDFTFCGHHYDRIRDQVENTVVRDDRWTLSSRASKDEVN